MVAYKQGSEIKKLVEEISKAQTRATPVTLPLRLTCTFDELKVLIEYVDKFIADRFQRKWLYETEEERVLLDAMEALAAALPSRTPG
jgi:hypothetical protein